jgi:hypothetical protein
MSLQIDEIKMLLQHIENESQNKRKLNQTFFNTIIGNPNICNLSLTDKLLKSIVTNIRGFDSMVIDFYKNSINLMKEQYPWMYIYFRIIKFYFNINFDVFSLGSSLEKPNMLWNTFNQDNLIKEIPFSGSMFDYGPDSAILLNESKRDDMVTKFPLLIANNPEFRNLVETLQANKRDVLITDVKGSGKSLKSILYLFQRFNINVTKLFFIYITTNYEAENGTLTIIPNDELTQYNYHNPILYLNSNKIDIYFIKGEDIGARCIAHYQREAWDRPPTPVFYDNPADEKMIIDNFKKCNINNFLFLIFSACFFRQFIIPKLKVLSTIIPEGQNMASIDREINDFVDSHLSEETKRQIREEQLRKEAMKHPKTASSTTYDDLDKKYLKYKLKYLKLKNSLKLI